MIFFAHMGPPVFLGRKLGPGWSARAYFLTAFFAVLPDIIDKAALFAGLAPVPTGRLWAHSLLFSAALCLLARFWLRPLWPWALAAPAHLLLDAMWLRPHTFLWPFLGNRFDLPEMSFGNPFARWVWMYHHSIWEFTGLIAGEALGLALCVLALRPLLPAGPASAPHAQAAASSSHS